VGAVPLDPGGRAQIGVGQEVEFQAVCQDAGVELPGSGILEAVVDPDGRTCCIVVSAA
jgi:hypothetical protein